MVRSHQEERRRTIEEGIRDGDRGKEKKGKTEEKVDGLHPRGHEPPGDGGGMDSRSASVEACCSWRRRQPQLREPPWKRKREEEEEEEEEEEAANPVLELANLVRCSAIVL